MDTRREALRKRSMGMKEAVDDTPLHLPGVDRPLTLREEMRRFIREELSAHAVNHEVGSFEEEDDFEIDDGEADLLSPYTVLDMAPEEGPIDDLEGEPTAEDRQALSPAEPVNNSDPEDPENGPKHVTSEVPRAGQKEPPSTG